MAETIHSINKFELFKNLIKNENNLENLLKERLTLAAELLMRMADSKEPTVAITDMMINLNEVTTNLRVYIDMGKVISNYHKDYVMIHSNYACANPAEKYMNQIISF